MYTPTGNATAHGITVESHTIGCVATAAHAGLLDFTWTNVSTDVGYLTYTVLDSGAAPQGALVDSNTFRAKGQCQKTGHFTVLTGLVGSALVCPSASKEVSFPLSFVPDGVTALGVFGIDDNQTNIFLNFSFVAPQSDGYCPIVDYRVTLSSAGFAPIVSTLNASNFVTSQGTTFYPLGLHFSGLVVDVNAVYELTVVPINAMGDGPEV